jgi:hypothetical protein
MDCFSVNSDPVSSQEDRGHEVADDFPTHLNLPTSDQLAGSGSRDREQYSSFDNARPKTVEYALGRGARLQEILACRSAGDSDLWPQPAEPRKKIWEKLHLPFTMP